LEIDNVEVIPFAAHHFTYRLLCIIVVLRNIQLERQALAEIKKDCVKFGDTYMSTNFTDMVIAEVSERCKNEELGFQDKLRSASSRVTQLESESMALKITNFEQGSKILTLEGQLESLSKQLSDGSANMDSENRLLAKHNSEMAGKLLDLNSKMEQMETFFRNDLETVVFEKDAEIQAVTVENDALKKQIELLQASISKLNSEYSTLKANSAISLENTVTGLTSKYSKELVDNKETISKLNEQIASLLEVNEKLQSDFNGILKREELLRKERQSEGKDSSDLRSRLFQVQTKLREIEDDSSSEIRALSRQLEDANDQLRQALRDRDLSDNASKQLDEQLKSSRSKVVELTKSNADALAGMEQATDVLKNELVEERAKAKESSSALNTQVKTLQQSYDELQKRSSQSNSQLEQFKSKAREFDLYKNAAEDEKEVLQASLQELRSENHALKANSAKANGNDEKVKSLEKTIAQLKLTIHKECEERTDMLIELSDLRDEIKRLRADRNSIGCGGLNDEPGSSSTGMDSGDQESVRNSTRKLNNYPTLPNGPTGLGRTNSLRSGQYPDTDIQPLLSSTGGGATTNNNNKSTLLESEDTESNKLWSQKFKKSKPVSTKGRR